MQTKLITSAGMALLVMSLGADLSGRPTSQETSTSSISFQQGVSIMRLVASAEVAVSQSRGQSRDRQPEQSGYGTLAEMIEMLHPQPALESFSSLPAITASDATSASLLDYSLRVIRSEDRQHYAATLTPVKGCGLAFSVDDRNVIYTGRSIGC